jgi:hypothetical protein
MKRLHWKEWFALRLYEWWSEPSFKAIVGFAVATLVLAGMVFAVGWRPHQRWARSFGPGWECSNTYGGVGLICIRHDLPPPPIKRSN